MLCRYKNDVSRAKLSSRLMSVVIDKQRAAWLLRGSPRALFTRTCGETTMARGQLDYKYWECVRTIWEFRFGQRRLFFANIRNGPETLGARVLPWWGTSGRQWWLRLSPQWETSACPPTLASSFPSNGAFALLSWQQEVSSFVGCPSLPVPPHIERYTSVKI